MKKNFLIISILLIIISVACTINIPTPTLKPGQTQTMTIGEDIEDQGENAKVDIQMNAGGLHVKSGGNGIIEGTIQYNIEDWSPQLTREENQISIQQEPGFTFNIPSDSIINKWDLLLGNTPLDLNIRANAYKGNLDLSEIPLQKLFVKDAASENRIVFSSPNPIIMESLTYTTSASSVEMVGLGYANFTQMDFNGSAGSYVLDFSGPLQQPADVKITAAGCNVKIIIPEGTLSKIENSGTAATVDLTKGKWNIDQHNYSTDGNGPLLNITVDIGAGRLELTQP